MKTTIELAKAADFHVSGDRIFSPYAGGQELNELLNTLVALVRAEALAEPVKQEPVAVISESAIGLVKLHSNGACLPFGTQLYAAPVSAPKQKPVVRARIAPPAPPEVYQMRSKDAYEAGWWEAQREKAVSPIAPVSAKRELVDLTCQEVTALIMEGAACGWYCFAERVQAAFKEKNK